MTGLRTYPSGVPNWVDIEQPDIDAACRFYEELFGWVFADAGPAEPQRAYRVASLDGQEVAAVGAGSRAQPGWNTHIAVDDVEAAAAVVVSHGGAVVARPDDAGRGGRFATCTDSTGASFRIWEVGTRHGAQLANVPGSWNFSNLRTDDRESATAFYGAVFGWEADALDLGAGASAGLWRRPGYGDHLEATIDPGIRARQAGVGAPQGFEDAIAWLEPLATVGTGSHWHVTFTVADRDASVATAERLGASTVLTDDTEWTRAALIRDPQGAELTLSQFAPPGG